jgi:hypothetical protein
MDNQKTITTDIDEKLIEQRTELFLTKSGYRRKEPSPHIIFQRGSKFGSLTSNSPQNWKVEVEIQISMENETTNRVNLIFHIDTTGQWVTDKERDYWTNELNNLEKSVINGVADTEIGNKKAAETLKQNWISLVVLLVCIIAFPVIAFIITRSLKISFVFLFLGSATGYLIINQWLKMTPGS